MTTQISGRADGHGRVGIDERQPTGFRGARFAVRRLVAVGLGVAMALPIAATVAAPAASASRAVSGHADLTTMTRFAPSTVVVDKSSRVLAATKAPAATCSQLTKAQVQPLLASHITAIKVTNYRVFTAHGYANGQQCNVAISDESSALTVVVLEGHVNDLIKGDEVSNHGSIKVPGIGTLAFRATGDGSDQVSSSKGNLYCSVVTSDPGNVPGIAKREEAAGDTSDIGDKVYGAISAALGTLCNRIYRSGNTTPNLHFPPSPAPTTTTFPTGLDVQK